MKKICIAEDNTILREGLGALLSTDPNFQVVCEAKDGLEAIHCAQKHLFDLILLDLSMPKMNGIEVIHEIKKRHPAIKALMLTVHDTEEHILAALQAGASGYLLKDIARRELLTAINTVLNGKTYLSPGISDKMIEGYLNNKKTSESSSSSEGLTHREREIIKLIAEGYKNKDIANYLHISVKTVATHRANLMKKLDLHSTATLTSYAIQKGFILR